MSSNEHPDMHGNWSDVEGNCHDCDGTGTQYGEDDQEHVCLSCLGSGCVDEPRFDDDVI